MNVFTVSLRSLAATEPKLCAFESYSRIVRFALRVANRKTHVTAEEEEEEGEEELARNRRTMIVTRWPA